MPIYFFGRVHLFTVKCKNIGTVTIFIILVLYSSTLDLKKKISLDGTSPYCETVTVNILLMQARSFQGQNVECC